MRTWVDVNALPACRGVDADDGMDRLDRLPPDRQACRASTVCLGNSAMYGIKAFQVLLEARAE